MIFVYLKDGKTLYTQKMCERIYDHYFQIKEIFDLSKGMEVIHIQMYAAKDFILKAGRVEGKE
jgi:hypothetical protein